MEISELLYRIQLKEFKERFKKVKEYKGILIWVSALTQCPRKWLYMLKFPEAVQYQFKGSLAIGKVAHMGLESIIKDNLSCLSYKRVENEVEVKKEVVLDDGRKVLITGRVDSVAYRDDEKILYEIKTAKSDIGIPHGHHILQLKIYMNILGSSKGILVYLTPERITEYEVKEPVSNEELKRLISSFLKFKGPLYSWECSYCIFSSICPYKKIH